MSKQDKINQYKEDFETLFSKLPDDKKRIAEVLYTEASFMLATLDELKETINRDGATLVTTNGNGFETISEHPAQKSYNTMIKNLNATIKGMSALMPEDGRIGKVMEWIEKR